MTNVPEEKKYWVAHVRGPYYDALRKKGFLVLYPDVDDYVFLEATKENEKYLKRQLELSIAFLKQKSKYPTVTHTEVMAMRKNTSSAKLEIGTKIEIISGFCDGLEGAVTELDGDKIKATVQGYNREYEVTLDRLDVIVKSKEDEDLTPD